MAAAPVAASLLLAVMALGPLADDALAALRGLALADNAGAKRQKSTATPCGIAV